MCTTKPKHRIISRLFALYRYFFSPWVGNNCRFYPTCSRYSEDAIETHGLIKGIYLTTIRLAKCNPWHPGGFDEVPKKDDYQKKEHL